jgi:hypothetical protein
MSHSVMTTARIEKTTIKLRGSFSPSKKEMNRARNLSFPVCICKITSSVNFYSGFRADLTWSVARHEVVQQEQDLVSLALGAMLHQRVGVLKQAPSLDLWQVLR